MMNVFLSVFHNCIFAIRDHAYWRRAGICFPREIAKHG